MSAVINRKWLKPTPSYWQDFSLRDDPRLEPNWRPSLTEKPRICTICGGTYTIDHPNANHRKVCYEPKCQRERKRRNNANSAKQRG